MSNKSAQPKTPWTTLDRYVHDWMDGAEVIGEDKDGMEGTVTLTERDQWMREDVVNGLLADEEFLERVASAQRFTRMHRRDQEQCETCGHERDGGHWGPRCEELVDVVTGEPLDPMKRTHGAMQRHDYLRQFDPPATAK